MKKVFTTFFVVLLALSAQAQRQSTVVQLLNNSSATGRVVPSANDLIGAGASYWTYCTTATSLSVIAEESPDNVSAHFVPVSVTYGVPVTINGNPCAVIQAGGLFAYPSFNVLSIAGGTISVWYSASTGVVSTLPPATNSSGATTPVQCDSTQGAAAVGAAQARIITGAAGKRIYVCGGTFSLQAAPTGLGSVALVTGTGSNCGTGTATIYSILTNTASPVIFPLGASSNAIFVVPPSTDLCLTGAANEAGTQLYLSYAQF
jgi:hypothetical protein